MNPILVGASSLNQTPLDWDGNLIRISKAISEAREKKIQILCLPELCLSGYGCEDMFLSRNVQDLALIYLEKLLPICDDIIVGVGFPFKFECKLYNCVAVISNKKLLGIVPKQKLANVGIHYEKRWFESWPKNKVEKVTIFKRKVPLGDIIFDIFPIRFAFEICADAWSKNRPAIEFANNNVNLILNPSASHFSFKKHNLRKSIISKGSSISKCTYIYSNLLGNESGRIIYDGGAFIYNNGELLKSGKRFSFKDYNLTYHPVCFNKDAEKNLKNNSYNKKKKFKNKFTIISKFNFKNNYSSNASDSFIAKDINDFSKNEEFARAMSLALFDYLRKTRTNGFVISLSGGVDSSSLAVLIKIMIKLLSKELSKEEIKKKLSHINLSDLPLENQLLICIYQATVNNSKYTEKCAESLSKKIGSQYIFWDINNIVKKYSSIVETSINRNLNWNQDDISMQNIQARVRSPGVWFIANIKNYLLLATGNRSETALGYSTMDGDTSGSLSPLSGVSKIFLKKWLLKVEKKGIKDIIDPINELNIINSQTPTAELRPIDKKNTLSSQSDEDDLMPYDIINYIEKLLAYKKYGPIKSWKKLITKFKEYDRYKLKEWVIKFFKLYRQNQWKRERYAPSFHFDDWNLDPKTGFRFPILNNAFDSEIEELKKLN